MIPNRPRAVTFDCWSTLITERDRGWGPSRRSTIVREHTGAAVADAEAALGLAWREHQRLWHHRVAFTGRHMAGRVLELLGRVLEGEALHRMIVELEDEALRHEIEALPGARETLARLSGESLPLALICDTGFTPGRVVRRLLDREGLLEFLPVQIFSDEVGAPKPHAKPFESALQALGVAAEDAVHVGDIRRSDVAGARAMKMGSIRLALHHDDVDRVGRSSTAGVLSCAEAGCAPECERPEADAVARDYAEVRSLLGLS